MLEAYAQELDEPTRERLSARIARTATILLIEHNMDVVMALAHRITVMDRGRILAEGAPDAIRTNEAVQRAYLGA